MKKYSDFKTSVFFFRPFLLLISFITIMSGQLSAQNDTRVFSVNIVNKTMSEALDEIGKASGYSFFYYDGLFSSARRVNLKTTNQNIRQTLDQVFEGSENTYSIDGRQVFIRKSPQDAAAGAIKSTVTGWVLDQGNSPVIGASVIISGTTTGVMTGIQGEFHFRDASLPMTLNVSFMGYVPQTVIVTEQNKDILTIVLQEDATQMDDVVVVGYGTQRRALVSSAISKMVVDESTQRQVASPSQLLQGRIAGVTTSTGSGNLGAGERMSIRGVSSLTAGNEPLYVIDGVPISNTNANVFNFGEDMSSLASLTISDIESVEVLKDAASAAIYGSRATNGVVLITTKSGREGRGELRVNLNGGVSLFPDVDRIKMVNSEQYLLAYNEGVDNYNKQYGYKVGDSGYQIHRQNPFGDMPDTDWMGLVVRMGRHLNIDTSISGGNSKTTYYVGAGYSDQEGIIRSNSLRKANFKTKVTHRFAKWIDVGGNVSGNYVRNNQIPGSNLGTSIIERLIQQRPYDRPYTPSGDYYLGGTDQLAFHNPLQILNEQKSFFDNYRFIGNFYANLRFLDDKLQVRTVYNADLSYTFDYTYYNEFHPYGTGVGRVVEYYRIIPNTLFETFATYNDKFGSFDLSAMLGHSFQEISRRQSVVDGRGFPSPSFGMLDSAAKIESAGGSFNEYAMESYFSRATLSYKDRYMFTATLRTDGSSKFARENRWGWFPSASFGWNVSKEEFMEGLDVDLKLRASYGRTGNQESIGYYAYQPKMSGGMNYGLNNGIAITDFGNLDLTWEKADQFDVGFDLGLLGGRLNMIFDLYQKNTVDLLYSKEVPAHTGTTSIISNIGSIRNRGVEFTLNTHFNFGNHFSWLSQFNISANKNVVMALADDDGKPLSIGANRALQVGKEVGAFYIFEMEGIYQYDGEVPDEQYAIGVRAGDVKWKDVDGNGIINDNDRVVTGSSNPDFFGGWNNSFRYKGFQMDIFFTYMYGNDVYAEWMLNTTKLAHNAPPEAKDVLNRWTGPGSTNKYPRAILNGSGNNVKNSTRILTDGSFIRLRSLTFSYNFRKELISRIGMKGLRVFFQGDNLFILTRYPGWDPEVSKNMDPRFFGVDRFNVPQPRTFTLGLNITF